jgi:hypothetical protein
MPHPAACGYPDVSSAGVSPSIARQAVSGTVTLGSDGQIYENKTVTGSIVVTGHNITIRNVKLINDDPNYAIRVTPGGSWTANNANLLLDHVEIDLGGQLDTKGVAFSGYTLRSSFIHNGSDCAHFSENVVIQDTLCTVGPDTNNDAWPDSSGFCEGPEHFDGFQTDGGANNVLRHNTVRNPCSQTSDILISSNTSHVSTTTIDNNLLAGGGYSLYCAAGSASTVDHITATNNRFARSFYSSAGYWGPTAYCDNAVYSGNVWDDTNTPV